MAGSQYPWAYSGPTRFSGPDLTRGQDVRALTIGVLAQSYLLSRVHFLLARKILTTFMTLLLLTVLGFGVSNVILLPTDRDVATTGSDHCSEPLESTSVTGIQHTSRIFFGLALAYNFSANFFIVGRLCWLWLR